VVEKNSQLATRMGIARMDRREPYEVCSRCRTWHISSEMRSITGRNANGQIIRLRLCPSCLHPRITYIQSGATFLQLGVDMRTILGVALAIVVIAVGLVFGLVIGSTAGFVIVVTCSLIGAGILASEAASRCGL
jgi:hypothetical protein